MKIKNNLNKESLNALYNENKEFSLPILSIVISILLFLVFIIPQLLSFPSRKDEIDLENVKLSAIKESGRILSTANTDLINSQVDLVTKIIPKDKSLEESLNAIFTSASLSNTQIESYNFQNSTSPELSQGELLKLNFEVNLFGGMNEAANFINNLYKTYPISEVENVEFKEGISTLSLVFYYSPFVTDTLSDRTLVKGMSEKEKNTLAEILKWNDSSGSTIIDFITPSTGSARTSSSPFE